MEEETLSPQKKSDQTQPNNLAELLSAFLRQPNPDIEHKLSLFNHEDYLSILEDQQQTKQIKVVCCSALKFALNHRQRFINHYEVILNTIESMYLSCQEDLYNPLEIILQKIFDLYLDDQKKLRAFQGVIDRLIACRDVRMEIQNQRALKLALLLVQAMNPATINNEICIGSLVCYLKQLYYNKHKTNVAYDPSGRGSQLLLEAMAQEELSKEVDTFLSVQIEAVKLMRTIVQKVEEEESQQPESIAGTYLRNSMEIQSLISNIICLTSTTKIYGVNDKVNQLKSELLQLYSSNYLYHIERPFLTSALSTLTTAQLSELTDHSMQIVSYLMLLVQRSSSYIQYGECFYQVTQILTMKLFELSSAREAERDALNSDPEYFSEIADDYCKTQESESMKARAGSLIYNLCMYIDGNLTFVVKFALIALFDLERQAIANFAPEIEMRTEVAQSEAAMKTLISLWSLGAESFTETSILVLSSISDLIAKRVEFDSVIRQHLLVMLTIFRKRDNVLNFFSPIILCRYIQLASYFSAPGCLDPFIPFFTLHEGVAQAILKALETVIQYHDKKNQDMVNYVANVSSQILLLPDRLTSLLETTIISRSQLLQCVKERLVQKLVLWLQKYLENCNVFGSNKISNLLCKVVNYYPDYLSKVEQPLFEFELQALAQYLSPLYRYLISGQKRQAEECVVDVAVAHAQILKFGLSEKIAEDFMRLGIAVVQRNQGVLGKCLELFSRLMNTVHMKTLIVKSEYQALRTINMRIAENLLKLIDKWISMVQVRDDNIWQLACLAELALGTFEVTEPQIDPNLIHLEGLLELCWRSQSTMVQIKGYSVVLLAIRLCPEQKEICTNWILRTPLPKFIPPGQKTHLCIYIIRSINFMPSPQLQTRLITYVLIFMMPNEQLLKYYSNYEARIHVVGTDADECQVYAYQALKDIRHPLDCWPTDIFEEFRLMFGNLSHWESVRVHLDKLTEEKIRKALEMKTVGARVRRIVRIKPLKI